MCGQIVRQIVQVYGLQSLAEYESTSYERVLLVTAHRNTIRPSKPEVPNIEGSH